MLLWQALPTQDLGAEHHGKGKPEPRVSAQRQPLNLKELAHHRRLGTALYLL